MVNPALDQSWHCLTIAVPGELAEIVSAWCFELGSCGLEVVEEGEESRLSVYFAAGLELPALCRRLQDQLAGLGLTEVCLLVDQVPAEDWEREWRRFFQPIWPTPRIVVHPSWIPVETRGDQVAIVIDPKMAFGTGGHESTQLCLELLDQLLRPGDACLDLGTGSGILGISAGLLGAGSLKLVDTDSQALENAAENLERNRVQATLCCGSIEAVAGEVFDLILANIQRSVLVPMLGQVRQLLRPASWVIFSGLLAREQEAFCREVEAAGLRVDQVRRRSEWVAVAAQQAL